MDTADSPITRATVYIETSIVSYLTPRPSRDLLVAAHQQLTVTWWEQQRAHYELFTSQVVLAEAGADDPDAAQRRVAVLERLPLLDVTDAAITLAAALVSGQVLPAQTAQLGGRSHLEKCFDRVNHDKLMSWVQERVTDRRVLQLIDQYLKAGALTGEGWEATTEGPPGWPPATLGGQSAAGRVRQRVRTPRTPVRAGRG